MVLHPHLTSEIEDVELLADGADSRRSLKPYIEAYAARSPPIRRPATSDDDLEEPISLHETAKGRRANNKKSIKGKQQAAESQQQQPVQLPLFGSANVRASDTVPSLHDVILNAGGPVWSLDWLPAEPDPEGKEAAMQYLAVAPHPKEREANAIGKPVEGPVMLQIWQVQQRAAEGEAEAALPRMVLGICHEGGIVRDAKWCPAADSSLPATAKKSSLSRLGLLAVLYGDGRLEVLAVPQPSSLESQAASLRNSHGQESPLVVRLKPLLATPPEGVSSLGSCIEWLPVPPHDLLLMGCWDGMVVLWKLPDVSGGQLQLLSHFQADSVALRSVAWAPAHAADSHSRHCFLTAGHASSVKVWDARDPFLPLLEEKCTASWILGTSWCADPPGILLCQDDGALRWIYFGPNDRRKGEQRSQCCWWGVVSSTIWSCHISPVSGHAAYAGDSGEVVVAVPGFQTRLRVRPPHHIVASTRQESGVICIGGRQAVRNTVGNRGTLQQGDVTDRSACVTRVCWSAGSAAQPTATWLASASATGLVRCQRISILD